MIYGPVNHIIISKKLVWLNHYYIANLLSVKKKITRYRFERKYTHNQ